MLPSAGTCQVIGALIGRTNQILWIIYPSIFTLYEVQIFAELVRCTGKTITKLVLLKHGHLILLFSSYERFKRINCNDSLIKAVVCIELFLSNLILN